MEILQEDLEVLGSKAWRFLKILGACESGSSGKRFSEPKLGVVGRERKTNRC